MLSEFDEKSGEHKCWLLEVTVMARVRGASDKMACEKCEYSVVKVTETRNNKVLKLWYHSGSLFPPYDARRKITETQQFVVTQITH